MRSAPWSWTLSATRSRWATPARTRPVSEISNIIAVHDKEVGDGGSSTIKERRYYIDPTEVMVPRGGQEAKPSSTRASVSDSMFELTFDLLLNSKKLSPTTSLVEDFDLLDRMMQYIYARTSSPSQRTTRCSSLEVVVVAFYVGVFFFQHLNSNFFLPQWNTKASREPLRRADVRALPRPGAVRRSGAMLVAFSTGRPTALVFDSGPTTSTPSPVVDGHVPGEVHCEDALRGATTSPASPTAR
ncbi:Actin-like 6A [Tyrophagus putrescentiae]|nr:Actin-like 6A [Tyrophagus putrescentiae]